MISSLQRKVSQIGLRQVPVCLAEVARNYLLWRKYKFERWHVKSTYACTPYKADLVALADSLRVGSALEIGCGLGDIIGHITAPRRYGFDRSPQVIEAAEVLQRTKRRGSSSGKPGAPVDFRVGSFAEARAHCRDVELLITVNWIHALPSEELKREIRHTVVACGVRYLLADRIKIDHGPELYRHELKELFDFASCETTIRPDFCPHDFFLFQVL